MGFASLTIALVINGLAQSGWNDAPALVPVNMDSVVVIEDFDDGVVTLISYPGEDQDPDSWELSSDNTYEGSPFSLKLFGNTWKVENVDSMPIEAGDVWQVSALIENVAEIQGFGVMDDANVLFYSFAGSEQLDIAQWVTVYQGAFENDVWNIYQLPIADDWVAYFGYLPVVTDLVYVNDNDSGSGIVYFDVIADITDGLPIPPEVEISYEAGKIYRNAQGLRNVDVQFYSTVTDPDSETHLYFWEFGDDSTSTEPNPAHTFLVLDDHAYTVLLEVVDDTNRWSQATCQVDVDPGPTTFPVTMNFVGDVMLARGMQGLIDQIGVEAIFEPTKSILGDAADITVVNLECPFTDATEPHPTKSIVFKSRPENIAGIVYAGIDVVSIGNNHILDYLYPGLQETQAVLDSNGILYSGAGVDSYEAYLPVFHSKSGVNIAFLASSDRTGQYNNYQPYLNAGFNKPGFALMEPYYLVQQIEAVSDYADLVVMEFHAGSEYTQYPSLDLEEPEPEDSYRDEDYIAAFIEPTRQNRELRQLCIDAGAHAVICHHPHVIQGIEVYSGRLIAHSLGDFVFDIGYAETFPSMILESKIDANGFFEYAVTPIYVDDWIPLRAHGELGLYILDYLARRSKELDTYLHVDRQSVTGTVILDTLSMEANIVVYGDVVSLYHTNGFWLSTPVRLKRMGTVSSLDAVTPPAAWEYRLGREIIWMGNFEDEGSTLWNINSSDEWYDDTGSFQGERSLCHRRLSGASSNIVTNLERRVRRYDGTHFTVHGCVKTQNGADVTIEARYYETRYTSQILGSEDIGDSISGDSEWAHYSNDFSVPSSASYFDIRCYSQVPQSGEALSWFDNVGIIQWEDWASAVTPIPIINPNDFYYIQLRTPAAASEANLSYTETAYGPMPLPSISVDPTSFEITLNPGDSTAEVMTISNCGAARLDFTVASAADWFAPNAWTGSVEPGADSLIMLTFDATGLSEGTYTSHLIVRSNDPEQSLLFLQTELTVTNSPIVHVEITPSGSSVELSWPAVPGATSYNIYRSETPFGPWSLIAVETATTYTDQKVVELLEQAFYHVTAGLSSGSPRMQSPQDSIAERPR